jgi:hypothetical protein
VKEIPKEMKLKNIKTNEELILKKERILDFLILTMADFPEQWHSWQDELFENQNGKLLFTGNRPNFLFPGELKPALWMSCMSKIGNIVKNSSMDTNTVIPPVFNICSSILTESNEIESRDLYWDIINNRVDVHTVKNIDILLQIIKINPYIAEPRILLSQIYLILGNFDLAEKESSEALKILFQWGTQWDKRISWAGWISWTRVMIKHSKEKNWPKTAFGMINLGKVNF